MKRIQQYILTVVICSFMALPLVYAQNEGGASAGPAGSGVGQHEHMGKKMQEIYVQLKLTDDQKKQLEANKQKQREQMKSVFEQMKTQREALHQELMKTDLDMNKINSIQTQIKTLQSQMIDNRLNSILEVRKILTPEQFKKFISSMEQRKHKWADKRGHKPSKDKNKNEEAE